MFNKTLVSFVIVFLVIAVVVGGFFYAGVRDSQKAGTPGDEVKINPDDTPQKIKEETNKAKSAMPILASGTVSSIESGKMKIKVSAGEKIFTITNGTEVVRQVKEGDKSSFTPATLADIKISQEVMVLYSQSGSVLNAVKVQIVSGS